jgi:hypothetical protein
LAGTVLRPFRNRSLFAGAFVCERVLVLFCCFGDCVVRRHVCNLSVLVLSLQQQQQQGLLHSSGQLAKGFATVHAAVARSPRV